MNMFSGWDVVLTLRLASNLLGKTPSHTSLPGLKASPEVIL
jgi:hypothetical protein